MGRHRQSGQPGSASSNSDAIANPDAEANPNANAITHPPANALANATTHPVANPSAHPIAASNTIPAPYPVTLGLTNTGGPSGSRGGWRWRPALYRCAASRIGAGIRDRTHPAGRGDRGRFWGPG